MADTNQTGAEMMGAANLSAASVTVELYAVVWSGLVLVVVSLLGVLLNLGLLLATRCKIQTRLWKYASLYGACLLNVVLSSAWVPLHFAVVLSAYLGRALVPAVCYAHVALFHVCVGALVGTTVLLVLQRLCAIWKATSSSSSRLGHGLVALGLLVCVVAGVACAVVSSSYVQASYTYGLCTDTISDTNSTTPAYPRAETILCLVYVVTLVSTLIVVLSLSCSRRQMLSHRCGQAHSSKNYNYHGIPTGDGEGRTEDDESTTERAGGAVGTLSQPSPTKSSLRENSDTKKSLGALSCVSKKVCLQEPTADDIHNISDVDDNDDDDTFDLKMRMKLAKRASGRRHTVANIGTGESRAKGRRGSMDDHRVGGSNPANYQYVRKWSVDIVALQDQLENPKLQPAALRELVELRDKRNERRSSGNSLTLNNSSGETPSVAVTAPSGDAKTKESDLNVITESEEAGTVVTSLPVSTCVDEPSSTGSLEVPAVTVRVEHNNSSGASDVPPTQGGADTEQADGDHVDRVRRRVTAALRSSVLLVLLLVCLLPLYTLLAVGRYNISVHHVFSSLLVLQAPVYPMLLPWIEAPVAEAVRRLRLKVTSLRCVCYCHVGKRRKCFGGNQDYN